MDRIEKRDDKPSMIAEVLMLQKSKIKAPSRPEGHVVRASGGAWGGVRNPRWSVILLQTAIVTFIEDLRAKHASPPIRFYTDNSFYTDIYTDNIHYTDKYTDKIFEDQNHNGRIEGDNGDGIYERTESWSETSPNLIDSDGDTFTDSQEKGWGYNPLSKDTDGDGIDDNIEDFSNYGTKDASETSAKLSDTDGDGLSDKMESEGWTVLIIYENTYEIINEYTVTSNPLIPDADDDGINDGGEFENGTDPAKKDTDGDGKEDKEEIDYKYGCSPTGIRGSPPEITDFQPSYELETEASGPLWNLKFVVRYKVNIKVSASDMFGISWIKVNLNGIGERTVICDGAKEVKDIDFSFTLDSTQAVNSLFNSFGTNTSSENIYHDRGYITNTVPSLAKYIKDGFIGPLKVISVLLSLGESVIIQIFNKILNDYFLYISNELINILVSTPIFLIHILKIQIYYYSFEKILKSGIVINFNKDDFLFMDDNNHLKNKNCKITDINSAIKFMCNNNYPLLFNFLHLLPYLIIGHGYPLILDNINFEKLNMSKLNFLDYFSGEILSGKIIEDAFEFFWGPGYDTNSDTINDNIDTKNFNWSLDQQVYVLIGYESTTNMCSSHLESIYDEKAEYTKRLSQYGSYFRDVNPTFSDELQNIGQIIRNSGSETKPNIILHFLGGKRNEDNEYLFLFEDYDENPVTIDNLCIDIYSCLFDNDEPLFENLIIIIDTDYSKLAIENFDCSILSEYKNIACISSTSSDVMDQFEIAPGIQIDWFKDSSMNPQDLKMFSALFIYATNNDNSRARDDVIDVIQSDLIWWGGIQGFGLYILLFLINGFFYVKAPPAGPVITFASIWLFLFSLIIWITKICITPILVADNVGSPQSLYQAYLYARNYKEWMQGFENKIYQIYYGENNLPLTPFIRNGKILKEINEDYCSFIYTGGY